MSNLPNEDISRFYPLIEKFASIKEKYGDNYPIIFYEPSINCQEKKDLKKLLQENSSIHLFAEFKEASKFVQSLGISFILIVSSGFNEQYVLRNFQTLSVHGRTMFDFEEKALFQDLFQNLSEDARESLKIKAFVFVTLLDFEVEAPANKENEEEVMIMRSLKDMAKEFRQEYNVIWYDPCICSTDKEALKQKFDIEERNIYENFEELEKRIHNSGYPPFHLILTGRDEIEKIVNQRSQLKESFLGLYIYCNDPEIMKMKNRHTSVEKTLEELIPKITEGIRTKSKLTNSFPAFATDFDALDKTHIYNLHYYLQGLINFENRVQAKNDFIKLAKAIYQSQKIFEFDQEYSFFNKNQILKWYAKESPIYKLVNNCLRIANSDSILYCRFLLRDLERAIREKYQEGSFKFNGTVYRGAYISQEEWEKLQRNIGREIEMYGFLSTSTNIEIAKNFVCSDFRNKVLITIIVPPLPLSIFNEQGFAHISQNSGFPEAEVLFNVRSKFRIVEAGVTKINSEGKECRHLVLLYGAQLLREYMTKLQPAISFEFILSSETKCGLCGSIKFLFAFQQGATEVRCLDCLIKNSVPQNIPLLALDFGNKTQRNELIAKSFKGELLVYNQAMNLPYYGYRCSQCQRDGKKKYYKWIDLVTREAFYQCSDCLEDKKKVECSVLVAETNPYVLWLESQPEWEAADADYQKEVSVLIKDRGQGKVYLDVQRFDLCMEYERRFINKLSRKRWREQLKIKSFGTMGKATLESTNHKKAFEFYFKALDISKFRHRDRDMAASYDGLASVCQKLGQNQEALQWWIKTLSTIKGIYGDNHRETAPAYNNIASAYHELGQYQQAFEYFSKALKITKATFGDKHPETAISYTNYAKVCRELGKYPEALEDQKKALNIFKALYGDNHPNTAISYNSCAVVLGCLGKHQEALEENKKALNIFKTIYGDQHHHTAGSYNDCSTDFNHLGRYQEAFEYQKKALDIRKTLFGDNHPDTAISYCNYAAAFAFLGKYQEALVESQKALDIRKAIFGDKHPELIQSYANLASICQRLEKSQEALEYSTKSLNLSKDIFGENHSMTATSYWNLGMLYSYFQQYQESFKLAKKALEIRETILGVTHPETADSYHHIAQVYQELGQFQKGLEYSKKAMNIFQGAYGEMHPNTAASYHCYAISCKRLGQFLEALDYLEKAFKISNTLYGSEDSNTIQYRTEVFTTWSIMPHDELQAYLALKKSERENI